MRQNRSLKGTLIATSRTTKLNYIIRVVNHLAMVGVAPLHKVVNPSSCKSLVNFGWTHGAMRSFVCKPCISWQWHWRHLSSFFACLQASCHRWSSWNNCYMTWTLKAGKLSQFKIGKAFLDDIYQTRDLIRATSAGVPTKAALPPAVIPIIVKCTMLQ